ncbi:MAG: IPT/TIG domain-containing protein [Deltaproteobacteria bacterium]|nr:IPT/TIG domain-containing protein [Deltaproteobacteria bacterium]
MRLTSAIVASVVGAFLAPACSAPDQGGTDATDEPTGDLPADFHPIGDLPGTAADAGKPDVPKPAWTRPAGSAAIRFVVDDTATGTYQDGQMKWTGSFKWSAADNTIQYSTAWQPTDGPFPVLYDDGPWSAGGHEPEGATKGDRRFECEVWFVADEETTFEYGVLNENDRWIWIGPNGIVTVPAGSAGDFTAAGLTLPGFGDIDFEVTLDTARLHADFATISPEEYSIFLKTSANSWFPAQLLDNGQNGDAAAGDGIFTYRQSVNMGPHDGLLAAGRHVQFVFVFALADMSADDGGEYKVGTTCPTEGVAARSDRLAKGTFADEPVVLERDSRGKVFNTTIVMGDGGPWCKEDADCWAPAGADPVACDKEKEECGEGTEPPPKSDPSITLLDPNKGPIAGGTEVTITGQDFRAGCSVAFGGVPAASVTLVGADEVRAVTPAHAAGTVTITLANPDGGEAACPNCFEFVEAAPPKVPDWGKLGAPLSVSTWVGVETAALFAEVYAKGVTEGGSSGEPVLSGQLGWGPTGSDPTEPGAGWSWVAAAYDRSTGAGDNNAVFTATMLPDAAPETLSFTFRFTIDGGAHWLYVDSDGASAGGADFSKAMLGTLDVDVAPTGPVIIAVEPAWGPVGGGTSVRIKGMNFGESTVVRLDGADVGTALVDDKAVDVTLPAHAMGRVDVTVRNSDGQEDTEEDAFAFVPVGTLAAGEVWDDAWRVGENSVASDWNAPETHQNELHDLYVAVDDTTLHVGVKGFCEGTNAIVGWVDRDPGAATGFKPAALADSTGALDSAVSAPAVDVTDDGFGAEAAFGTVGMQIAQGGLADGAGWRGFVGENVGAANFAWIQGDLVPAADKQSLVASIPLETLYGGAVPAKAGVGLFVRIVSADGNATANQCLPEQEAGLGAGKVGVVAVVPLR